MGTDTLIIPASIRKVRVRKNQSNSFGLYPGLEGSCPGATTGPGGCLEVKPGGKRPTCYVFKAFRSKRVVEVLKHNYDILRDASLAEMVRILDAEFTRFETADAASASPWYNYRLHWAGDVFSKRYATALAKAAAMHPKTSFWLYTRSFDLVDPMIGVPNLKVYLSADPCNMEAALETMSRLHKAHPELTVPARLAHMAKENKLTLTPCPQDEGNLDLEGACARCRLCVNASRDVWFKVK